MVCAPVYSAISGLETRVIAGPHESAIHCDNLVSIPKSALIDCVGSLGGDKTEELDQAIAVALAIED